MVWWFPVSLMLEWLGGNQRSCVDPKSLQGSVQSVLLCGSCTRVRQGNNDLQDEPSSKHTQSQKPPAEGKPPQTPTTHYPGQAGRQGCGHSTTLPKGCSAPVGHTHTHCSTSTWLSQHPPPQGISFPWAGRRYGQLLQFCCFILLCPQCAITQNTES